MRDPKREGLKAAADVLARAMCRVAAVKTRRGAEAVNTRVNADSASIRAGHPEGVYGWDPITALMFEDNMRHPLFGNKGHWYSQGRYPITELTERAALDEAVEAFADAAVPAYLENSGLGDNTKH